MFDAAMFAIVFTANSSSNQGNFIELLKWASATDPTVQSILNDCSGNATYLSASVQNELIHVMANQIREQISQKVSLWGSV